MMGHPYSLPILPYDRCATGYHLTPPAALEPSMGWQASLTMQIKIPIGIHYIYVLIYRLVLQRTHSS